MAEKTIAVDEAMKAYETLERVKEKIADMEREAKIHYKIADEHHNIGDTKGSSYERMIGNAIMEDVTTLKQILG